MKKVKKVKAATEKVMKRNTKKYGARHTPEERKELLAKYRALRKKHATALDAAKQVGVKYITLRSWALDRGQLTRSIKKPKAKKARGERFKKKVRVTFKNGTVIDFQTLEDFAKVVKSKI